MMSSRNHTTRRSNQTEVGYRLAWARTYLKKYGLLENSSRGIWSLTPKAKEVDKLNSQDVVRAVRALDKKDSESKDSEATAPQEVSQEQEWKQKLHSILTQKLSPGAFERLVQRLLRESGFTHVDVRGIHLLRGLIFGRSFQAWVIYQRLALRMSYRLISKATFDLFSEQLAPQTAADFVERFSEDYRHTEDLVLRRILNGPVVHLDETKISILGADQYVWVLTDNSHVVFRLRPNRETEFLKPLFADFKGTIVSDFYGGYDALPCRQQKCLVHLIGDLNDDLWKNPFDDEFERFIVAVRDLLCTILEDVQRYGLKACHLRKHRHRVERFYREAVTGQGSAGDTTARYRKRFERYKTSLFSFIENDGVPWHNNAAERALRHLAVQRKISGAFSERGAADYLRLLGIAQTCRFQQKSFLGFLLSKSKDVDEYRERGRAHPDWTVDSWDRD